MKKEIYKQNLLRNHPKMLNIKEYLSGKRDLINESILSYLPDKKNTPQELFRAIVYSIKSGGKRLRPILTLETGIILGAKKSELLPVACAMEFIHTYSLIHDDLPSMDNDDFRRGKPTVHKKFGEAVAILAGDALLTRAFEIIANEITNPTISRKVISEISRSAGAEGMVGGQVLDIAFSRKATSPNNKLHTRMLLMKTGMLIKTSVLCGAIVAGADNKTLKRLESYGKYIGLAFQIKDDTMDIARKGKDSRLTQAKQLINQSKKELLTLGKKTEVLHLIADYVINRTY
jgi:geranylgeranyl diphosphate synthase type II